jgi:hypothetical protein
MVQPEMVLKGRLARRRRELLVRWKGASAADASWVPPMSSKTNSLHFSSTMSCFSREGEMSCGEGLQQARQAPRRPSRAAVGDLLRDKLVWIVSLRIKLVWR